MNCTAFTASVILSLNAKPYQDLYSAVSQCPNICQTVYGTGDVDLTGIGVIASTCIQIFFSLLYFAFLFIDAIFIPAFKPSHKRTAVTAWLEPHQQTCLYSSLLFTFTLSLATTIYQLIRENTGFYDSMVIIYNIYFTFCSFLLISLSCYNPITRPKLFALGYVVTGILALTAALYPVVTLKDLNVMQACSDFANSENLGWRDAAPILTSRDAYTEIIGNAVGTFLIVATWVWLRRLLHYNKGAGEYTNRKKRARLIKALTTAILVLSLCVVGLMGLQMWQLFRERSGMDIVWQGTTGVNQMGIGQIGAPLAWAPLIIDMLYSATERVSKWWTTRRREREEGTEGRRWRGYRFLRF